VPNHFCIGNVVDNDFCHFGEVPAIPFLDNNERQIRRPGEEEDTLTLIAYMLISLSRSSSNAIACTTMVSTLSGENLSLNLVRNVKWMNAVEKERRQTVIASD